MRRSRDPVSRALAEATTAWMSATFIPASYGGVPAASTRKGSPCGRVAGEVTMTHPLPRPSGATMGPESTTRLTGNASPATLPWLCPDALDVC